MRSATGTLQDGTWQFDFPFNSAASAEASLFFAVNYAHDFFYDLGFDEAAGNFQADNFNRGGLGGDPLKANARAAGRNNANYVHAPDGSSPTMNMFLWDGSGCWSEDTTTHVFPLTIAGITCETSASNPAPSEHTTPMTPIGSGTLKSK